MQCELTTSVGIATHCGAIARVVLTNHGARTGRFRVVQAGLAIPHVVWVHAEAQHLQDLSRRRWPLVGPIVLDVLCRVIGSE